MIHCYQFYASPVISKPLYFELFLHFPWDFEIAGFNCTRKLLLADLVNELPQVKLNETALQAFWEPSTE